MGLKKFFRGQPFFRSQRFILLVLISTAVAILLAGLSLVGGYYWFVVKNPPDAIRPENINRILSMESPVYYSDATHKAGVFFEEAHRQYVPFHKIPSDFINAIIAAEDNDFFNHPGVDFSGLARAMLANIKAGRVVQGGSTLTQQTAKNLFKRKDRSVKSKLKELLFALQLEHHYPKEKILEFYTNQFYVSGNGMGLGVAARYYFNKAVEELSLVECAFIAGSVKRPNYYNPHLKKGEEKVNKAKAASKRRTAYVLGQLYKLDYIGANSYQRALVQDIPFAKGQTRYASNTLMDMVKEAMAHPIITEAFEAHGIENIATSGVRVITTVDRDVQASSLFSLRSELARLDMRLTGYDGAGLQAPYEEQDFGAFPPLLNGDFFMGRIVKVESKPMAVQVSFDSKGAEDAIGVIDEKGLKKALVAWVRHKRQRWSDPVAGDLGEFLKELRLGDLVYVSVRDDEPESGPPKLTLEKFPELQGAMLARQEGVIRAMTGGMTNRFYNRAITARRPMGSVIKPLVYGAALQLGWNSLDLLHNERAMFVYDGEPYFPRPDHHITYPHSSMLWAGVQSENLASVWLLYHLCDRLTPGQFKELLAGLGMAREEGESYIHYARRIRDDLGVVVNQKALRPLAFSKARTLLESDLIFDGYDKEAEILKKFYYGDFSEFLEEEEEEGKKAKAAKPKKKLTAKEIAELELRKDLARYSFSRLQGLHAQLEKLRAFPDANLQPFVPNLYYLPPRNLEDAGQDIATYDFVYTDTPQQGLHIPMGTQLFTVMLSTLLPADQDEFWERVSVDGLLPAAIVAQVSQAMGQEFAKLRTLPPYSDEVLYSIHDFRVMAGLQYLIALCRELGVESDLQPVLSFPLGSNVISLYELARIYEGLTTGFSYSINGSFDPGLDIISRIETHEGEIIYSPKIEKKRVFDRQTALAVSDILRNVVRHGTGRYAYGNIPLSSRDSKVGASLRSMGISVPALGKTGTANNFTNATFAGFMPSSHAEGAEADNGVVLDNGLVLACYVGYDDNRPMERNTTHISGSAGALPMWTMVAADYVRTADYAKALDLADLSFSGIKELPLYYPDLGQRTVVVASREGGRRLRGGQGGATGAGQVPVLMFVKDGAGGKIKPQRYFRPFWSQ
ncbi:MAG: transglycosylase domain-containing protein [Thermodesulfobacteriota bacterium]